MLPSASWKISQSKRPEFIYYLILNKVLIALRTKPYTNHYNLSYFCDTSERENILSWAVWCDSIKQFREYLFIMVQDITVNGGSFYENSGSGQVRIVQVS